MRLLLAIVCLCLSFSAHAWWNKDWTQRKQIGIDTTATGANLQAPLTEVPVLVRLHSGNFPQFLLLSENAADFRFVDGDDQTPLRYHVERFDPSTELAYVWVNVPALSPQSDQGTIFLYFGNPAAPPAGDAPTTFDVDTVAAFHFAETAGLPRDSTAYGTPVTAGEIFPNPASLIGTGATLSGSAPLVIGPAPQLALSPDNGWSLETWVRVNTFPAEPAYLIDVPGETAGRLSVLIGGEGSLRASLGDVTISSALSMTAASWHHVAVVVRPDALQLFLDGQQVAEAPAVPLPLAGPVYVGGSAAGTGTLAADLDELRISKVARSPEWIGFSARVQGNANDRVLRYGLDAGGKRARSAGNFGIIFQNVFGKPEAWVEQAVIILCGLMMLGAAVIMFLKGVDLTRSGRATKAFLTSYSGLGLRDEDDLDALYGERRRFGDSPLWRVYHVGLDEIRKRLSPAGGGQSAGLDQKALDSVRAAMDATMVREGQRLNSQLILLTIAISGGPFIGLFGTVVGVMVTFAAIAATGDVNIAAIAPGMAAALLATVAGLGVAIPALFGYNYLSSRVKDQMADTRVFVDELLARFNEQYGT